MFYDIPSQRHGTFQFQIGRHLNSPALSSWYCKP